MSGASPDKRKSGVKPLTTLTSRADKLKNFTYISKQAKTYADKNKRQAILPPNFESTHIHNIIDANAQDSLLHTIELIINVMLDHEKSD